MKKSIIRILAFFMVLALVLGRMNQVFALKFDDGLMQVDKFYEQEDDSIDVLFLGSSHAFMDVNTGTLWDEYGMASYLFASRTQPTWNSYYYLREVLKTQKPKLIVLEGYRLIETSEYMPEDGQIIANNFGLKASKNKLDSVKTSAPEERWYEFILEYMQYHTRYKELSSEDFLKNKGNPLYDDFKGYYLLTYTESFETVLNANDVTAKAPLSEKTENYYRKTIELAQENDIPIAVVISPYAGITESDQQIFNTAADIAAEYDVPFLNCNLLIDEIGMDWMTDAAEWSHLNYRGAQKYTSYLGGWLKDNFTISDRRGDDRYDSWQRNADYIFQMIKNQELVEATELTDIAQKLNNEIYTTMISIDGSCDSTNDDISEFLDSQGIEDSASGIWTRQGDETSQAISDPDEIYFTSGRHDFCLKQYLTDDGQTINDIIIDNQSYKKVTNGVNVVVWDNETETVVTAFGLDADNGYAVVK